MPFSIQYYSKRVLAEIESWPAGVLADYAKIVELLAEHGPALGMPHARAMGQGLYEVRPRGREGIGRAFYCFVSGGRVVVLHAFIKKTQTTPQRDLLLARARAKELRNE